MSLRRFGVDNMYPFYASDSRLHLLSKERGDRVTVPLVFFNQVSAFLKETVSRPNGSSRLRRQEKLLKNTASLHQFKEEERK